MSENATTEENIDMDAQPRKSLFDDEDYPQKLDFLKSTAPSEPPQKVSHPLDDIDMRAPQQRWTVAGGEAVSASSTQPQRRKSDAFLHVPERSRVTSEAEDPLSSSAKVEYIPKAPSKSESLTLKVSDESRIINSITDAAKKKKTGSLYSVAINFSLWGSIGLGVKNLANNFLVISMLKRQNGQLGPGESAGVRLGDIVIGVDFTPCRDGAKTLLRRVAEKNQTAHKEIHLQCWRCHQLCTDRIPGAKFPRADDVFVKGHSLYRTKVFDDWERWNFIEILLRHLQKELEIRHLTCDTKYDTDTPNPQTRAIQNQIMDLERNILQAKGLRSALCVRIVHTKYNADETVLYALHIEDIESGLQWTVMKRYRDFHALSEELSAMSHYTKDIPFPKKNIVRLKKTSLVVEERIIALESYIRRAVHRLTLYSPMDAQASKSLRHLQDFLGVNTYINCLYPPPLDDQHCIELMVHKYLNDFNSLSCHQCVRFVDTVDLDALVVPGSKRGYAPVLELLSQALSEVEQFTIQQYGQQLTQVLSDRRPDASPEQLRTFVRRCVRRQVEAAIFLPLRRNIVRIVYGFIAEQAQELQDAIEKLKHVSPAIFSVDPLVVQATSLNTAVQSIRKVVEALLPADQGQRLMHAASSIMQVHTESTRLREASEEEIVTTRRPSLPPVTPTRQPSECRSSDMLNKRVLADPVATLFSAENSVPQEVASGPEVKESPREIRLPVPTMELVTERPDRRPSLNMTRDMDVSENIRQKRIEGLLESVLSSPTEEEVKPLVRSSSETSAQETEPTTRQSLSRKSLVRIKFEQSPLHSDPLAATADSPLTTAPTSVTEDEIVEIGANEVSSLRALEALTDIKETKHTSSTFYEKVEHEVVVSADDFLPMFTYVLVQADFPQLLLVKELMVALVDDEEMYGECGYYMATLEAATQHIINMALELKEGEAMEQNGNTH